MQKKTKNIEPSIRKQPTPGDTVVPKKLRSNPNRGSGQSVGKRSIKRTEPTALLSEHASVSQRAVAFTFFEPTAKQVFLAGSFNDWASQTIPLAKGDDGRWAVTLVLPPGSYEYRLIVDDVWREDPMAARFLSNPYGGLNSVVVVEA